MIDQKCLACGQPMVPRLDNALTHPTCLMIEEPVEGQDPFSVLLKQQLTEIILWQERQNPRNTQANMGPSEIGNPCDRHIGYRLADIPGINVEFDPWASIVGSAVHAWLEQAVRDWDPGAKKFRTETTLELNDFVTGHADLYSLEHSAVIDWKTAGNDVLKKVEYEGPSDGYRIQTHIYGYMFEQAGYNVRKVALVFMGRASTLKRMFVWSADYSREVAETALGRLYGIAQRVVELDPLKEGNEHRWEQLDAVSGNHCGFCPWYDPGRDLDRGADATGCAGR